MKRIGPILSILLLVAAFGAANAGSESKITPENAKKLFETKCSACHPSSRVLKKPNDAEGWQKLVKKMQGKKSGWINDDEAAVIVQYLVENAGK